MSTKPGRSAVMKHATKYVLISAAVVLLDRITKRMAFSLPFEGVECLPGILRFRYTENTGMAFSMFSGNARLLGVISLIILAAAVWLLCRSHLSGLGSVAASLMLGGAAGNMVDRLIYGYVVDMIEVTFVRFAVFNAADCALVIGCILMVIAVLTAKQPESRQDETDDRGGE